LKKKIQILKRLSEESSAKDYYSNDHFPFINIPSF
jgi:hypothetical protein